MEAQPTQPRQTTAETPNTQPRELRETQTTQQRVLEFIRTFRRECGYSPTVREITDRLGLSSTSIVEYHLRRLRAAGQVYWQDGKSRTLVAL